MEDSQLLFHNDIRMLEDGKMEDAMLVEHGAK